MFPAELQPVGNGIAGLLHLGIQRIHGFLNDALLLSFDDHQEFIAAQAVNPVFREHLDAQLPHKAEHFVTCLVTQAVVQLMKPVDIDEYHRQLPHAGKVRILLIAGVGSPVLQPGVDIHKADDLQLFLRLNQLAAVKQHLAHAVQRDHAVYKIQQGKPRAHHRGIVVSQQPLEGTIEG